MTCNLEWIVKGRHCSFCRQIHQILTTLWMVQKIHTIQSASVQPFKGEKNISTVQGSSTVLSPCYIPRHPLPHNTKRDIHCLSLSRERKPRQKEIKLLTPGHTTSKWWSWDSKSSIQFPGNVFLSTTLPTQHPLNSRHWIQHHTQQPHAGDRQEPILQMRNLGFTKIELLAQSYPLVKDGDRLAHLQIRAWQGPISTLLLSISTSQHKTWHIIGIQSLLDRASQMAPW